MTKLNAQLVDERDPYKEDRPRRAWEDIQSRRAREHWWKLTINLSIGFAFMIGLVTFFTAIQMR